MKSCIRSSSAVSRISSLFDGHPVLLQIVGNRRKRRHVRHPAVQKQTKNILVNTQTAEGRGLQESVLLTILLTSLLIEGSRLQIMLEFAA